MFMVDIAVPRDIEAEVGALGDVYLYTIDNLKEVVHENLQSRLEAAKEAEQIIDTHVTKFMHWVRSLDTVPSIRALRETADAVCEAELERARRRLALGEDPEQVMERLARALTNKFMHAPTTALRSAHHGDDATLRETVRKLFNLHEHD
jgi:glutamyl-tRNA reductase